LLIYLPYNTSIIINIYIILASYH